MDRGESRVVVAVGGFRVPAGPPTATTDSTPPLEVIQHGYRPYPLVDRVADKIAATYERYGTAGMPSTRYRDLVDPVSIISAASVSAASQIAAPFARGG